MNYYEDIQKKPSKNLTEKQAKKKALALFKALKIPYTLEKPGDKNDGFVWNGKFFKFGSHKAADIIHDLAHYMISPKTRHHLPEFGLGGAIEATREPKGKNVWGKQSQRQREEEFASILGIFIEKQLLMNYTKTFKMHGWDESEVNFKRRVRQIITKGFINKKGICSCIKKRQFSGKTLKKT